MQIFRAQWLIVKWDRVLENGALVIKNGRVDQILTASEADRFIETHGEAVLSSHHLIFPGFINAHMHQYGVLSHGIPVNVEVKDFEDFLWKYWWPFMEDRIRRKEALAAARLTAAEMIESGVTGFCDTLEAPKCESGTLIEQAKVIEQIGMRAILSLESCERIDEANGLYCLEENKNLIQWARENSRMIEGAICTHTSFTCSVPFMEKAKGLSDDLGAMWQFHLSESRYEPDQTLKKYGKRPAHHYDDHKLLSGNVLASQCVKVDSDEIAILKEHGVRPVHMPMSNCEVGGGIAPVPQMLEAGLPVALGTDGYDNDFLRTAQMAFLIHKAALEDPSAMPASQVFRMATENGAKALGWKDCGTLEEGYCADFVCMERLFPTPLTRENIFDQLVVFAKKEYISHVYCNGNPLMENRRLTTLDRDAAREEADRIAADFWEKII